MEAAPLHPDGREDDDDEKKEEEEEKQGVRENMIASAEAFLTNPKVVGADEERKEAFLKGKGLTKEEIEEAKRRVTARLALRENTSGTDNRTTKTGDRKEVEYGGVQQTRTKPWEQRRMEEERALGLQQARARNGGTFSTQRITQLAALVAASAGLAYYYRKALPWPFSSSSSASKEEVERKKRTENGTSGVDDEQEQSAAGDVMTPAKSETTALESQVTSLAEAVEKLQTSVNDVTSSLARSAGGTAGADGSGNGTAVNQSIDLAEELRQLKLMLARGGGAGGGASNANVSGAGGAWSSTDNHAETDEYSNPYSIDAYKDARMTGTEAGGSNVLSTRTQPMRPADSEMDTESTPPDAIRRTGGAAFSMDQTSHAKSFGLSPGFSDVPSAQLMRRAAGTTTGNMTDADEGASSLGGSAKRSETFRTAFDDASHAPNISDASAAAPVSAMAHSELGGNRRSPSPSPVALMDTFGTRMADSNTTGAVPPESTTSTASAARLPAQRPPAVDEEYEKYLRTVQQPGVNSGMTPGNGAVVTSAGVKDIKGKAKEADDQTSFMSSDPPHPQSYLEVMAALQEGRPIPGIRQIDDSPPNPKVAMPESNVRPPSKPWQTAGGMTVGLGSENAMPTDTLRVPPWLMTSQQQQQ